jgi:hypothetical protein
MLPFAPRGRGFARAVSALLALSAFALAPATSNAATTTFGSDLTAPANVTEARQADTAYWQNSFGDGHSPVAPASGQITSFRVKGIALSNPVAGVPGGETMFHLQALHKQPDGTFLILRTSDAFDLPTKGSDPQAITTFKPTNFCIDTGDVLVFNTVGGWDGVMNMSGPYPMGTPLQIFSSVPGAVVSEFEGANLTNNGNVLTANNRPGQGHELLMQMTVGTGDDATPLCPGGTKGVPPASDTSNQAAKPAGPPPPPRVQKATLPAKQRVTVSRKGKLAVSVFCLPGAARCAGTVQVMSKGAGPKLLGTGRFDTAAKTSGRATIHLNTLGRRRFSSAHGRLGVRLVATTKPGGAEHTSSLSVTLRRRG